MNASRQLLAAARRAMTARRDWHDAQVALSAKGLHGPLRDRALERMRTYFNTANDFLALVVCQELGIDSFGHELVSWHSAGKRRLVEAASPHGQVKVFRGIRITECSSIGRSRVAPARTQGRDSVLGIVQARVRQARAEYNSCDDRDVVVTSRARAAYMSALIEYFNLLNGEDDSRSQAAE
ncbi:hypothetical protein LVJ94_17155 [Pendulispora rubella]|uniref:Uncharacterized protein n=1 Tax=Pendulispora rubella TaxID=2741070 RepID=A0ABZ2LF02_9BACT